MEESRQPSVLSHQTRGKAEIINLADIQKTDYQRLDTGVEEFNRVLGGGIVPGSLVLVSGDPGIGKSTLLTHLALNVHNSVIASNAKQSGSEKKIATSSDIRRSPRNDEGRVLYVAGEESAQQIKIRVDRMKPQASLLVLNETDVDLIIEKIQEMFLQGHSLSTQGVTLNYLVIVDSIQALETGDLNSVAGSIGQVRECAHRLQRVAKQMHLPIFLVGHVNKDGMIAGPKTLEHMVDVVLSLEGEPTSNFRILRGSKNRFGPTDEVGIFEMGAGGMIEVKNPSKLFLEQKINAPGSAIVATMSGTRPLLVEIQALVTKSFLPMPRRTGSGVDNNRLQLLVAVLMKRLGLSLFDKDIFVNVTGGLKVNEPAADLSLCMAIVSSLQEKRIAPKTVFVGEVGLLGEVRGVSGSEKRIKEAKKLGFSKIISPENAKNLAQAVELALSSNIL